VRLDPTTTTFVTYCKIFFLPKTVVTTQRNSYRFSMHLHQLRVRMVCLMADAAELVRVNVQLQQLGLSCPSFLQQRPSCSLRIILMSNDEISTYVKCSQEFLRTSYGVSTGRRSLICRLFQLKQSYPCSKSEQAAFATWVHA
jgi:hypothetical protein